MSLKLIVAKLQLGSRKFITGKELREYCRELGLDYYATIRYLTHHRHLARIFKGVFYIRSLEERKLSKTDASYLDIIKSALEIKGIKSWYFGMETALKLNNLTHEYFVTDCVVSDSLFRAKPITILGHKIRFVKLSPKLIFGIKNRGIPYSEPEKTALDLLYLKRFDKAAFLELSGKLSKNKLTRYALHYSRKVAEIARELK